MKTSFIHEPSLEFGDGLPHIDIRAGVRDYGPLDLDSRTGLEKISIGVIGDAQSIHGITEWLDKCREGLPAKASNQPNLFPSFPGMNTSRTFRASLDWSAASVEEVRPAQLDPLLALDYNELVRETTSLFAEKIRVITERLPQLRAIVVAEPLALVNRLFGEPASGAWSPHSSRLNFHDLLKARAMKYRVPTQLVLPGTYDAGGRRRLRGDRERAIQDEATRAWNLHTALYYKAGGIPWRIKEEFAAFKTCYVGIAFYMTLERDAALTSVAQVFNGRGEGAVIQGGVAEKSEVDKQPHLDEASAHDLLQLAIRRYKEDHGHAPARVVLHKSSSHSAQEISGFESALKQNSIDAYDMLWVSSGEIRLFRPGRYPPLRGTLLELDAENFVLYTVGSVNYFRTYPGMYVPSPLHVRCQRVQQPAMKLAEEMLALSKMNWNKTQFDGREPMTLHASRQLGGTLKYLPVAYPDDPTPPVESRYRFYM